MLHTFPSLLKTQGPGWLAFRLGYTAKCRLRWFERRLPCSAWTEAPSGTSLTEVRLGATASCLHRLGSSQAVAEATRILEGKHCWFSRHEAVVGYPPDWAAHPWAELPESGDGLKDAPAAAWHSHWSRLDDFAQGDIKAVWELARFGFIFPLVRAWAVTGEAGYPSAFWEAIEDWRVHNPPQCGPHWKCGQEISLRMISWVFGYLVWQENTATTPQRRQILAEMLEHSCRRIELNLSYALHQQNNHGMSEAAGLWTAGILLGRPRWIAKGKRLLDELAEELIYRDGSFSQHSAVYHRLMLQVYLWAIALGRAAGYALQEATIQRVQEAGRWLQALMLESNGRVPNLGPNDGAHCFDLTDLGYLDFRPTVQAVGMLTEGRRWLASGPWDEFGYWLAGMDDLEGPGPREQCRSSVKEVIRSERPSVREETVGSRGRTLITCPEGGYVVWRDQQLLALFRCPQKFRHRPSQCDFLHFDLWWRGENLLRDAGSYSYNCEEPWQSYFGSSLAHNTIRVDDRDPMPKVSRFLYSHWPRGRMERRGEIVTAAYRDYAGFEHERMVGPVETGFRIDDRLEGTFQEAVLRWRLAPERMWTLTEDGCHSDSLAITVTATVSEDRAAPVAFRLVEGWESLYYLEKTTLPVLEVRLPPGCQSVRSELLLR